MIRSIILTALFAMLSYGALMDDMDKLEKDLEKLHLENAAKKSLNDLSIDELVGELKKEVDSLAGSELTSDSLTGEQHDTFRSRFDSIVGKTMGVNDEDKMWEKTLNAMSDEIIKRSPEKDQVADESCKDERSDCDALTSYCETHRNKLKVICRKTCGYCGTCEDFNKARCQILTKMRQCTLQRERMTKMCPKSCNLCKAPAPPKCSKTKYGCCWDKETVKSSANGKNCPRCEDAYKYVCETFNMDCGSFKVAGDFMRRHCPGTCNLCSTECRDDSQKGFYCKFWKNDLKWCTEEKEIMRHYCPKTCAFC